MNSLSRIIYNLFETKEKIYTPILGRLKTIYEKMGVKYQEVADGYGFNCTGCDDSCCFTHFYHHTLLEYFDIMQGFHGLEHTSKTQIAKRAAEVCTKARQRNDTNIFMRLMCPLNFDGLCVLYDRRPMICRLHGIPYKLCQPGQKTYYGSGCHIFYEQFDDNDNFRLDRTLFYVEIARLEKELKYVIGMPQKIKFTVAEMISTFLPPDHNII